MPRFPAWDREELFLLVDLFQREGRNPAEESVAGLREVLVTRGRLWTDAASDPSFRSKGSIWTQLWRLSLLAMESPRAEQEVGPRMREVWFQYQARPEVVSRHAAILVQSLSPLLEEVVEPRAADLDRIAVHGFVAELRLLLEETLGHGEELVGGRTLLDLQDAWSHIERERVFERALRDLVDPRLEIDLASVGLVEAPRELKTAGFTRALERLYRVLGRWTWPDIKPVFKWANVILGSLTRTMAGLDPIKEYKEIWEAAAEEVYESA